MGDAVTSAGGGLFLGADRRPRSGWRVAALLVTFLILQTGVGVGALLAVAGALAVRGGGVPPRELQRLFESADVQMACALVLLPLILLAVWPLRRFLDRRSYRSLGFWVDRRTVPDVVVGLAAGGALVLGMAWVALAWGLCRWPGANPQSPLLALEIALAAAGLVAAALVEELVCRAGVQGNLAEGIGATGAIAVTSALFSLLHGANPNTSGLAFINLFLAGVLLGLVYQRCRTLWAPWALHFAWNFTMGPVLGVNVSGTSLPSVLRMELVPQADLATPDWGTVSGGAFGFEGGLAATAVLAAAVAVLAAWKGRPPRPEETVGLAGGQRESGAPAAGQGAAVGGTGG